ncbi:unnamed protein product [Trichobilharzia szidati]|nr:unnamed protein product [Trichobilharzia szidati]
MRLIILEDPEAVTNWAAKYIMKRILEFQPSESRHFTLGLPTGSTVVGMYQRLVDYHHEGKLSFRYVKTFNMDEYIDLSHEHPQSYHYYMYHNFFKHIDIDPKNVHLLDGTTGDPDRECESFEMEIKNAGGIHLFVGGMGSDGHIAFNEPGSSLVSRTRVKTLTRETVAANARFFGNDITKVPKRCLTVGVGTIMDAEEIMILVTGASKALALHKAIEEGVNHMWTVSALQLHKNVIFVVDEDATMELHVKTVRYFKDLDSTHLAL